MNEQNPDITPEILKKYDRPGPRYTSYPTAPEWDDAFGDTEYRGALTEAAGRQEEGLSVYIHVPFCWERCSFCGCNVVISKKPSIAAKFLDYIDKELDLAAEALGDRKRVIQYHWGGGTPTYLTVPEIERLHKMCADRFQFDPDAEIALEVDPRVTTQEQVSTLRALGFNRISMGVQDLDPVVQNAINRDQTEEETRTLFDCCREAGFGGINMDLIYGLPLQTMEGWDKTIEAVIDIKPDRLAIYSYAHLPSKIKQQVHIDPATLPAPELKYELSAHVRRRLLDAGYRTIAMDHYALPTDELSKALDERRLHRNFMGYSTIAAKEMVGIGPSAIGEIGGVYAQNEKRLVKYYRDLDEGRFATASSCRLSDDDKLRSWVIRQIMCNFTLPIPETEERFGIRFDEYFAQENEALEEYYAERFAARTDDAIEILPLGQVFVRNIAMVFDAYLRQSGKTVQFSRTV